MFNSLLQTAYMLTFASTIGKPYEGEPHVQFDEGVDETYLRIRRLCFTLQTANILEKLPKNLQKQAKSMLQEIWMSDTKNNAFKAYKKFIDFFKIKYPKATECLEKDKDRLLTFYDFPAENWQHIRTTNPIESTFATVRHST